MRPQQQNRRMRGRNNNNNNNNNNRKGPNPLTRSYESNGPDVKIRGSAQQIAEKYATLARDAMSSGDRVMAENYLQHAEHYNRIIAAAQAQMPIQHYGNREEGDEDMDEERDEFDAPFAPQPNQSYNQQRPQQENRGDRNQGGNRQFDNERRRDDRPDRGENRGNQQGERGDQGGASHNANGMPGNGANGYHPAGEAAQSGIVNPAEAPQPVIEGVPAEVAGYNAENGGEGFNNRRRERRNRFNERFNRERNGQPRDGGEDEPRTGAQAVAAEAAPVPVAQEPAASEPVPQAAVAPEAEGDAPSRRGRRPRRSSRGGSEEGAEAPSAPVAEFDANATPASGANEG